MDAHAWMREAGWLRGVNYIPRTAVNQLEMWQEEDYAPAVMDEELGWAAGLGFNAIRVFFHNLVWDRSPDGYLDRIDHFLGICSKHRIRAIPVFFDCCWNPDAACGIQPPPRPFVHNSGWVQCPTAADLADPSRRGSLEAYQKSIMERFAGDPRIVLWDLYNEPGNISTGFHSPREAPDKSSLVMELLLSSFQWAGECGVTQPVTAGVWQGDLDSEGITGEFNRRMVEHSDVASFHSYEPPERFARRASALEASGKPVVCTEYMARSAGNTFVNTLPFLRERGIGAISWGFVSGKTQTEFPWDSWSRGYDTEPDPWFHDILRPDGSAADPEEAEFVRALCTPRRADPAV